MLLPTKDHAMSRFSEAQKAGIEAEARANVAKLHSAEREPAPSRQPELVYKTHVNDSPPARSPFQRSTSVASGSSELPWWQWVDERIAACLEAYGEEIGTAIGDFCGPELAAMRREIKLLQRELVQLREQIAVERGLKALREEVEVARRVVPKVPALVEQLEAGQDKLRRELKTTNDKLSRVRVNQCMTDYRLSELRKETEARAAGMELKIESSSFVMRDIHPDARAALRDFAAEAVKNTETLWVFDPGATAGTA
jgi:hypothetical protein